MAAGGPLGDRAPGGHHRGRAADGRAAWGMRWREDDEISAWFGDWELISPGLVPLGDWRPPPAGPGSYPEIQHSFSGGMARKR